jgi:hypothetical protein
LLTISGKKFEKSKAVGVVCIYCNYKEQYRQTAVNLVASVWRQLIQPQEQLPNTIRLSYNTHMDRGTSLTLFEISKELRSEIEKILQGFYSCGCSG